MRTKDAVSAHTAGPLAFTLGLFVIVYLFVFGVGVAYILRLVRKGPVPYETQRAAPGGPGQERQQMRPISAATPEDSNTDSNTDTDSGGR
jgi:cytochrome d ubiquinol oxidase subunit I